MAFPRVRARAAVLVLLGLYAPGNAPAQSFPARPVRYLMPLPAGSETDIFARVLAKHLTDAWGQQVLVVNRPGAGGSVAARVVVN
jgi:tripartite-type tricarboxylate transporter receptor subunit TctC